jgi:acyl carrier protein
MNKNEFLEGLQLQFEDEDANNVTFDTKFSNLDTWDSLTEFAIIVFLKDKHQYEFVNKDFEKYNTPIKLFNLIYK